MLFRDPWAMLQIFAGEGAGASGAVDGGAAAPTSGDNSADAGQQRLRELGVPEDKIKRHRAKLSAYAPKATPAEAPHEEPQQAAAAEDSTPTEQPTQTQKKSFKDLLRENPDYDREMQDIVKARLRKSNGAEEALGKLAPALEMLAKKKGISTENMDYDALARSIMDDDSLYEEKALEMGVSVDIAKKLDQQAAEIDRRNKQDQQIADQQRYQQHFNDLDAQSVNLKSQFPGFDLRTELQNPVFERLTRPGSGLSVEDAYFAVHRKDIQTAQAQVIATKTAQQVTNAIRSNSRRPDESGAVGQAPSTATFDYRNASKQQREALKAEIRRAAARGEKLYPR